MNRRGFLRGLIAAAAGFAILPSATTYVRNWFVRTPAGLILPNPEWVTAEYEMSFMVHPTAFKRVIVADCSVSELERTDRYCGHEQMIRRGHNGIREQTEMVELKKDADSFRTSGSVAMVHPVRYKALDGAYKVVPPFIAGTTSVTLI